MSQYNASKSVVPIINLLPLFPKYTLIVLLLDQRMSPTNCFSSLTGRMLKQVRRESAGRTVHEKKAWFLFQSASLPASFKAAKETSVIICNTYRCKTSVTHTMVLTFSEVCCNSRNSGRQSLPTPFPSLSTTDQLSQGLAASGPSPCSNRVQMGSGEGEEEREREKLRGVQVGHWWSRRLVQELVWS